MRRIGQWVAYLLVVLICIGSAVAYYLYQREGGLPVAPVLQGEREPTLAAVYAKPVNYDEHLQQLRAFQGSAGRIAYSDHGPADAEITLVLVHGVPTSSWMYRKLIPLLQQNMRVIAIDLLGYGASDKPRNDPEVYSHASQASYVSTLLRQLGIDQYALLVHDMGGLVGWELMRSNAPISHMVLLNTIIHPEGFNNPTMGEGFMTEAVMKAYSAPMSSAALLKGTFDELGLSGEYTLTEEECEAYVRPLQAGADKALYSFFSGLNDALFSSLRDNAGLIAEWPGDITVFPQHSHFLAEEAPAALATGVIEFLTQP